MSIARGLVRLGFKPLVDFVSRDDGEGEYLKEWLSDRPQPSQAEIEAAEDLPASVRVYKAPMFRKMTDAEYDAYLQIRAGFPPRLQAIFDAAEYLSSDDEFWPDLVEAAEQAYGAERAAELLSQTS